MSGERGEQHRSRIEVPREGWGGVGWGRVGTGVFLLLEQKDFKTTLSGICFVFDV